MMRCIGDGAAAQFLKELDLTEGKATGIPKINKAMRTNGSPKPVFRTDDDRTFFLAMLPVHPEFLLEETEESLYEPANEPINEPANERQKWFIGQLVAGARPKAEELAAQWDISLSTAKRDISELKKTGLDRICRGT